MHYTLCGVLILCLIIRRCPFVSALPPHCSFHNTVFNSFSNSGVFCFLVLPCDEKITIHSVWQEKPSQCVLVRGTTRRSCLAENNFRARFICVSYFSYVHFCFVVSFILMPEIKEKDAFLRLGWLCCSCKQGWNTQGERARERKKTAQQDSYHLSPQCDSLISVGLSSPLTGPLHQHPSIIPYSFSVSSSGFYLPPLSPVSVGGN